MSEYTFRFIASQAADGVVFTAAADPNPMSPGNLAGWSSASFALTDSNRLSDLEPDGGHWVGAVHMLPDSIVNMTATYFPIKGKVDNIQLAGPIMTTQPESAIAVVGGGGKFASARGQARCTLALSDQGTPVYRYELTITV
jgi:hypothetical protein